MTNQEMMQSLVKTVSDPKFSDLIREIEAQPEDQRQEWTKQNATVERMQARGIPVDTTGSLRSAVRIFENSEAPTVEYDTIQLLGDTANSSITWTFCTSVGCVLCCSFGSSSNSTY